MVMMVAVMPVGMNMGGDMVSPELQLSEKTVYEYVSHPVMMMELNHGAQGYGQRHQTCYEWPDYHLFYVAQSNLFRVCHQSTLSRV